MNLRSINQDRKTNLWIQISIFSTTEYYGLKKKKKKHLSQKDTIFETVTTTE